MGCCESENVHDQMERNQNIKRPWDMNKPLVTITGITGFLGAHVCLLFL